MTTAATQGFMATDAFGPAAGAERLKGFAAGTGNPKDVAAEFAGLFYSMMLGEMEKTVPQDEYFGSRGEEIFRSMWVDELGKRMAQRRGDPLTKAILSEIEKNQGRDATRGAAAAAADTEGA